MAENNLDYLDSIKENLKETKKMFDERGLKQNKFCIMPFVNIILEPNGEVGLCRHKGAEYTFGNIRDNTIDEIWSSAKVQNWRKDFQGGNSLICHDELIDRRCNLCPELNKLLPYAEIDNVVNPKILRLTANLNGQCNLECQMCKIWKMPNGYYTDENFWIPARNKFFKDIREVDMLSGEPFIQKDTYRLIDEVSGVNPMCEWTFTTNLHWLLTDSIKEKLDKIKIKNIIVSIDSLEIETYSKIRKKGDLSFVLKNLDSMIEYEKERKKKGLSKLNIRLNFLVQQDNWKEIKNAINYCLAKRITPFLSYLYRPEVYSLDNLSQSEKMQILDFYFSELTDDEILFSQRVIKPLIRSLDRINYVYYLDRLKEINERIK